MALRAKEMMRSVMKKVGDKNLNPRLKQELKKNRLPDPKIVMGRAQRGIYAGRHIQFGNNVSEDGGNKFVFSQFLLLFLLRPKFEALMIL